MNGLIISSTSIRRDANGRFSLNDLHRAAGGESKHQPSNWLRLDHTRALCAEIDQSSEVRSAQAVNGGAAPGTYVVKELVYAYAMWISPAFHLKVIRAYDAIVAAPQPDPMAVLSDPAAMRGLLLTYTEKVLELEGKVAEQAPKVQFHDQVVAAPDAISMGEAAKVLGTGRTRLMSMLRQIRWLNRYNEPYQDKIEAGLLDVKLSKMWEHPEQGLKRSVTPLVTGKGLARLKAMGVGQPMAVPVGRAEAA